MGWEVITNKLNSGSLESLPEGTVPDADFYNAFFKAYKERADYIYKSEKSTEYDDLLLVDDMGNTRSGILSIELKRRLEQFNDLVISNKNNSVKWYKESSWDEIVALPEENLIDPIYDDDPDLGLVTLIEWTDEEVEALLGSETYDDIFNNYSVIVTKKASYWSGIYKLLKYVFKYQEMIVDIRPAPVEIDEPIIYFNGSSVGGSSDSGISYSENPAMPTTTSDNASDMLNNAISDLSSLTEDDTGITKPTLLQATWSWFEVNESTNFGAYNITRSSGGASIRQYTRNPFFKVPSKMRVEMLAAITNNNDRRRDTSRSDYSQLNPDINEEHSEINTSRTVIAANKEELIEAYGDPLVTTYTPDPITYNYARGLHYSDISTYSSDVCSLDLSFLPDVLSEDKDYRNVPLNSTQGGFNVSWSAEESVLRFYRCVYNFIISELPQNDFEFPT